MGVGQLPTTEFNDEELDDHPETHLDPASQPAGGAMIQLLDAQGNRREDP